jgi:Protein of unknown function (DUF3011)
MFRLRQLLAIAAVLMIFTLCASEDGRRHSCSADTRGGVEVQNQHSKSRCDRGYSWGVDRGSIWVDHGCRADFKVGSAWEDRGWGSGGQMVSCSSDDMRRNYCDVETSGGVRLIVQRSESDCLRGQTWREHHWREEFDRDEDYDRDRHEQGFGAQVSCSSDDMRRHYCDANTWRGVVLVHVHSDSPCIFGKTWGYDRRGVWVDRGCRAEFRAGQ